MDGTNIIRRLAALLGLIGIPLAACDYEDEPLERDRDGDFIDERHVGDDDVDDITQEGDLGPSVIGFGETVPTMVIPMTVTVAEIDLDPKLAEVCNLSRNKTFFEFDSARITSEGHQLLDQVATCMSVGRLRGQKIDLVGFTDPRGSVDYNKTLGADRAASVRDYLVQKGVEPSMIDTSSEGEKGALANDLGMAKDRRVVIRLDDAKSAEATAGVEADDEY